MKKPLVLLSFFVFIASSIATVGCSSTPKKQQEQQVAAPTTAAQPTTTTVASNANLGASSSGRGR